MIIVDKYADIFFDPLDDLTGQRFVFFQDPDQLPIELYEGSLTARAA
ncbi:MAG: hypothetical protein ACOYM4_06530 [Nodosilinea sp.]